MAMDHLSQLTSLHLDVLREVGNIGSGHAATALATMLNTVVDIEIPRANLVDINDVCGLIGARNEVALGLSLAITDDMDGMILHIIQKEFINTLTGTFFMKTLDSLKDIEEMEYSLIHEVGNITSAAYVNALADMLKLMINIGPPNHHLNTLENILKIPATVIPEPHDQVLYLDQKLRIASAEVKSSMILILDTHSLFKLFDRLHIKY